MNIAAIVAATWLVAGGSCSAVRGPRLERYASYANDSSTTSSTSILLNTSSVLPVPDLTLTTSTSSCTSSSVAYLSSSEYAASSNTSSETLTSTVVLIAVSTSSSSVAVTSLSSALSGYTGSDNATEVLSSTAESTEATGSSSGTTALSSSSLSINSLNNSSIQPVPVGPATATPSAQTGSTNASIAVPPPSQYPPPSGYPVPSSNSTPTLVPGSSGIFPPGYALPSGTGSPAVNQTQAPNATIPTSSVVIFTQNRGFAGGGLIFLAHIGSSETSFEAAAPTDGGDILTTTIQGSVVVATAIATITPSSVSGETVISSTAADGSATVLTVVPFLAHLGASEISFDAPIPTDEAGVITTTVDGTIVTATAAASVTSQASQASAGAGLGGLLSAIGNVASTEAQATTQAASQGSGSSGGGSLGGIDSAIDNVASTKVSESIAGSESLGTAILAGLQPLSTGNAGTAAVIALGTTTATQQVVPVFAVGGQTLTPGGSAATISGTIVSALPSGQGIVVGGQTVAVAVPGTAETLTTEGQTITIEPTAAFAIGTQTLVAGGPAITVGGTALSLVPSATAVVIGGFTSNLGASQPTAIPLLTIGSETFTANAATEFLIAPGETLTPGGQITVSGTTISLGSSASNVVINGVTTELSAMITPAPVVTVGGIAYVANAGSTYEIGGQSLTPGGVITVSGTTISLASGASDIVVNGVTQALSPSASVISGLPVLAIEGKAYTANAGSSYIIDGQTLVPGGTITLFDGSTVSLAPSAADLVIDGVTSTFAAQVTAAPLLTIEGQVYTANAGSAYVVDGQTLMPGGVVTLSDGTTVSLAPSAVDLVINGVTSTIAAQATITAPPLLTIDGQIITAAAGSGTSYLVSGQLLTPGGAVTFMGPNGLETVSLNAAGTAIIDIVSGATSTSTIPAGYGPAGTVAPVLTIDGETFTALPGAVPSYLINGDTLTPGGVLTETISGSTFILSLSPSATVLVIEQEGAGGNIISTMYETLFPARATLAAGTDTVTVGASAGGVSSTQQAGATTSAGSSTPGASLQSTAASARLRAATLMGALGVLALAVWL